MSNVEIFKWLESQDYQTERDETGEYKMYFSVDMPKILMDFVEHYQNTPMKGKTLNEHLSETDNCCCKEGLVCSVHDDYIGMQS